MRMRATNMIVSILFLLTFIPLIYLPIAYGADPWVDPLGNPQYSQMDIEAEEWANAWAPDPVTEVEWADGNNPIVQHGQGEWTSTVAADGLIDDAALGVGVQWDEEPGFFHGAQKST